MTKSAQIRALDAQGVSVAEIAKRLGIRYQHAYNVLRTGGVGTPKSRVTNTPIPKPSLNSAYLLERGFERAAIWSADEKGDLLTDVPLPDKPGVYAFAVQDIVQYIGVATMGVRKRLYFYSRPGVSQTTSIRIRQLIVTILGMGGGVDILAAFPPDHEWNGLKISGAVGLESGLISEFSLPWNVRGAVRQLIHP